MKKGILALALLLAAGTSWAEGRDDANRVSAKLDPRHEVPAVSSPASGRLTATIDEDAQTIDYELTFEGLQANVVQSHIHFAQPNVNGAILVWLCGTAATPNAPAGTPTCPQSGTVTGTIRPANIQTATTQGIAPGEFAELIRAIRSGLTYVNIHTAQSPGGELRGQLRVKD